MTLPFPPFFPLFPLTQPNQNETEKTNFCLTKQLTVSRPLARMKVYRDAGPVANRFHWASVRHRGGHCPRLATAAHWLSCLRRGGRDEMAVLPAPKQSWPRLPRECSGRGFGFLHSRLDWSRHVLTGVPVSPHVVLTGIVLFSFSRSGNGSLSQSYNEQIA